MPEGPEVHRQADQIRAAIAGEVARHVHFGQPRLRGAGPELTGQRVEAVRAAGKAFLIEFEDARTIYVHLQLYGKWVVRQRGGPPKTSRTLRLQIDTDRGSAFLYSASEIAVLDPEEVSEHGYLSKLGPDLLAPETDLETVLARIRDPELGRRRLGNLYLDQGFLAGLGNYLRTEILHEARLHPDWRLCDLDGWESRRLAKATLALPRRSYETGGITNDLARAARLKAEGVKRRAYRWQAFARAGKPCYRCGGEIERCEDAGRRLYICYGCQE